MDPDTQEAMMSVILDLLADSPPGEDGMPSDEAWAQAQQVLDMGQSGEINSLTPAVGPSEDVELPALIVAKQQEAESRRQGVQ